MYYDNDGCPDIFIANGHVCPELESHGHPESPYRQQSVLYHNLCNGTFQEVTSIAGPGLQLRRSGRGAAFLDYDNDGAIDIAVNNQNDPPTLLHNGGVRSNHWVTIRTVGTRSNRDGIGARVSVTAGGRRRIAEVQSGGSYISQSGLRLPFGLGQATKIDVLENPLAERPHGQTGKSACRPIPGRSGRKGARRGPVVSYLHWPGISPPKRSEEKPTRYRLAGGARGLKKGVLPATPLIGTGGPARRTAFRSSRTSASVLAAF